jgi:hypothetical protein
MHHLKAVPVLLVLTLLLWVARPVFGQAVFGNITGTVTDPSGAAVANATLVITDLERGISYSAKTNSVGNYTQTHLLAGRYEVKVNATGFSEFSATAEVQVDATTRVDAQMKLGKAASTVTVTTETPLLKVDRADVSNTLTDTELERLPILNRNKRLYFWLCRVRS